MLDPVGGQTMITRFDCPNLLAMLLLMVLHVRVEHDVRRQATGFVAAFSHRNWRTRTVLSVSLWRDLDSVYSMGAVGRHIYASRIPRRLGIATRCGVFCYAGDWRRVMFGAPASSMSPLVDAAASGSADDRAPESPTLNPTRFG